MTLHPEVVYDYIEDVDPNLTCAICQSALVDPVTTASCKHTFCRDCITRALQHNPSCPIDRSALNTSSLRDTEPLVQLMLDEMKVRCNAEGCGVVMQRGLLIAHLKSCTSALEMCGDDGCGLSMARSRMPHHRAYECFQRQMRCDKCDVVVTFKESKIQPHTSCEAELNKDHCPLCSQPLFTSQHLHKWTCPAVAVPCTHSARGCPSIVKRADLGTHLENCPFQALAAYFTANDARFRTLEQKFVNLQAENENLRAEIRHVRQNIGVVQDLWAAPLSSDSQAIAGISLVPPAASMLEHTESHYTMVQANGVGEAEEPGVRAMPRQTLPPVRRPSSLAPPPIQFNEPRSDATTDIAADNQESGAFLNSSPRVSYGDQAFRALSWTSPRDTRDMILALRASLIHIAAGLDSVERRSEVRTITESLRVLEEVGSLRAIVGTMRMQVMIDRPASPLASRFASAFYPPAEVHTRTTTTTLTSPTSSPPSSAQESMRSSSHLGAEDDNSNSRHSIRESVVFSAQNIEQHASSSSLVAIRSGNDVDPRPPQWTGQPLAFPTSEGQIIPSGSMGRTASRRLSQFSASLFRGIHKENNSVSRS